MSNKSVRKAAVAIWDIISTQTGPRDAAKAIAAAHLMLIEAEGVTDEAGVRARLTESMNAILETWLERSGAPRSH